MANLTLPQQPVQSPRRLGLASLVPSDMPVVIEPEAALQLWADRIRQAYERSVGAIVAAGKILIEAKASVKHGGWVRLFRDGHRAVARPAPFSERSAQQLMTIARHAALSNTRHWRALPSSWRTLAELARLEPAIVEKAIKLGIIFPDMTRKEALQLVGGGRSARMATLAEEVFYLEVSESRNNSWAAEVNRELSAPLQFSADGRIVSGVFWLPEIPVSTKAKLPATHRCVCQACGHSHTSRHEPSLSMMGDGSPPRIEGLEGQLELINQDEARA